MRRIVWAAEARQDYRDAIRFLAEREPAAIAPLRKRIEDAIDRLARQSIGRPGRVGSVLEKPVIGTSYTIAYDLRENELHVLRIVHQRRQWPQGGWPKG